MRSRKLLALIFSLLAIAPALAGYMTLLGAGVGSIQPVVSWVSTTDPTFPSSSLTYSGPSLSTMFDSTGKLTFKPNQLNDYSTNTAQWINATGATWSGNTLTANAGAGFHYKTRSLGNPNAQNAIGLIDLKYVNNTWAFVPFPDDAHLNYVNVQTGAFGTMSSGVTGVSSTLQANGSYRFIFKYSGPILSAIQAGVGFASADTVGSFTATGSEQMIVYRGMVSAVTYESTARSQDFVDTSGAAYYGPRIDYDPNTLAVKGLLREVTRTNLAFPSNNFADARWLGTTSGVTINSTNNADPAGTNTATNATFTNTAYRYNSAAIANGTYTFTVSVWLSGNIGDKIGLRLIDNASSLGFVQAVTLTATGLTRYQASGSVTVTAGGGILFGFENRVAVVPGLSNATVTVGIYGFQIEVGPFVTSYIPTSTAAVTRAGDVLTPTGVFATTLGGTSYSAFLETAGIGASGTNSYLLAPDAANKPLWYNGGGVSSGAVSTYNGSVQLNTVNSVTWANANRFGFSTSSAGRSIVANGGTVATDANAHGALAGTIDLFDGQAGATPTTGWIKSFAIYNQRLSDTTLQAKSVVGASYAANDNANPFAPQFAANDNLPVHWRIAL